MNYKTIPILLLSLTLLTNNLFSQEKPNIIFILMDDLGYGHFAVNNDTLEVEDFDPYFVELVDKLEGYSKEDALAFSKRAIPTISKLANEGIVFNNAYATSNLCSPSRMGIATGILQNRFGVHVNADKNVGIPQGAHLAEKIHGLGYKTAHIGKWHLGPNDPNAKVGKKGSVTDELHPLNNGFDYYYGYNHWGSQFYNSDLVFENYEHAGIQTEYNTDTFTDKALDFMMKYIDDEMPFYVQLHYHAVHDSLEPKAPAKYFDKFDSDYYDLNNFYAHLNGVDENIKRIVDYLESKGELENTLILFSSDNGAQAGGSYNGAKIGSPLPANAPYIGTKGTMHQGGVRVPLFVYWKNGITAPHTSEHLVSTMDIIPTSIAAAGGTVPTGIDGKSLLPIFIDQNAPEVRDYLLFAGRHAGSWGHLINKTFHTKPNTEKNASPPAWAVMKEQYMLRFTGEMSPNYHRDYPSGRKPVFELFDVKSDPKETKDLSALFPELVIELGEIFCEELKTFATPDGWGNDNWNEIKSSLTSDLKVLHPIEDITVEGNTKFNFTIPIDTFVHQYCDDVTYVASQSDGNPLPDWITFDAEKRTFVGTSPSKSDELIIKLTAQNNNLQEVSDVFQFTIKGEDEITTITSFDFKIFPNPTNHSLYLQFDKNSIFTPLHYSILDLNGKSFGEGEVSHGTIDVAPLENGFYLLVLIKEGQKMVYKFIGI
ncbi:sulfatase-like hydrolase/transferase [Flammeovirga aprica]|uniref:Sulfatase-like hydrolase/transferase n=1 Tax=Flammeovirga aprica JL-4 TaxID=694437 RepID=A0A7X9S1Y4_9BACT|nr:sulfatase-like hydrolase/transferase [Flammeovirga aprica]NME72900.1 sulfatase-like hydrolase/transferase [Flammeovirga aprica JL-4]